MRSVIILLLFLLFLLAAATLWAWRSYETPLGVAGLLRQLPIDLVWLSLIPALLLLFLSFRPGLSLNRLFASFAIPVALFAFAYSFEYVSYHTLHFNDSPSYLKWVLTGTYASNRNSGYATILAAINGIIGIEHIAWFQFGMIVACYLTGVWLLCSCFRKKWLAPLLVGMFLTQGVTSTFSDQILTEALFTAGLGLFSASLGALAWQHRTGPVTCGIVGIVLAVLAKSIGVVLIIPALLTTRFLPKGVRFGSVSIAAAGIATYVAMASYNYSRTGTFAPESFAGETLAGHVAWMLDDTYMPRSVLTHQMLESVAEVVRKRPGDLTEVDSLESLDRYVDYTADEYDELFWSALYTVGASHFSSGAEENAFYLRFALSSIRAHPAPYFFHSAAHFYGLWRDVGNIQPLREATIDIRARPLRETVSDRKLRDSNPTSILARYPEQALLEAELGRQKSLPLSFPRLWDHNWISPAETIALGILTLVISMLFFIPSALARMYRTEIMIALSMNAYFAAHALMMGSLPRYANVSILAAFFFIASFFTTSIGQLKALIESRRELSDD